jgi:hypothetical protein
MRLSIYLLTLTLVFILACHRPQSPGITGSVIAPGHAVSMVRDQQGDLHLAFCRGDSILYSFSGDRGKSFSDPVLVAVYPGLASSHARGPQIAVGGKTISIVACDKRGNLACFQQKERGSWVKSSRVNDRDSAAIEGLMSLAGDDHMLFAVWLDARDKYTKIYGAASSDGGGSWSRNSLIYASPDSMVCPCCRPSVALQGDQVYVMFRNLIHGNRDLYLIHSADGGKNFGAAEKLGAGSWALNGCPMDGGALVIRDNGQPETIWRRQDKIYSCIPGKPEQEIADGRSCSMASAKDQAVYVWTDHGQVISQASPGRQQVLGEGSFPAVNVFDDAQFVCVWEHEQQIHAAVVSR